MKFEVKDAPFSILVCQLDGGEMMKCQSGAMAWMTRSVKMQTKSGGLGGMFKKAISGESLFLNNYVAEAPGEIAFGMSFPGHILAVDVTQMPLVAQKKAFLASESTVSMDVFLQKKIGAGFFGGEGFIMEKFSGSGYAFLEVDGAIEEKVLGAGEQLVIDSGYVAAMEQSVSMDIEMVKGLGNIAFGGEGLFNTILTGPGRVWLQTMPISALANSLAPLIAANNGK
ncbi:TIGR00266 family protein [Baileyella intestinalis]|jgi:uncharacterized protein (TIGR00266 family)|uniref:TIGR00266 family protein n=1 Tax=Baileyella intestinalis TaxID=2606709 RepID=UPI0022DF3397|nr:TIGR00266 family protein [Baileyella intestinalis]